MSDLSREALVACAEHADWGQVISNGGPPCFHVDGNRFCLRAKRWGGHDGGSAHVFISLADLLQSEHTRAVMLRAVAEHERNTAEAHVATLTARWDALKAILTASPQREVFCENILDDMAELEAQR